MPNLDAVELNAIHAPNADTGSVISKAAIADKHYVIDSIHCGYNAAPGAVETLAITIGGNSKGLIRLANVARDYRLIFPRGLYVGTVNEALLVSLSAPSTGAKGALNITYRTVIGEANLDTVELNAFNSGAAGNGGIVTIAAVEGLYHVIDSIHCNYDTAPAAVEDIKIETAGVETFKQPLPAAADFYEFLFPHGHYKAVVNQEVVVTVSDPGASVRGQVLVTYHSRFRV